DVFVYASETETMGNVVLEAMASGCPVVAPHAGGIPSLLAHGTTGFLYRPGDADEAARGLRSALDDEGLRCTVGRAARGAVQERSWADSVARVRQAYAAAIEPGPRPAPQPWIDRFAPATLSALVAAFRALAGKEKAKPPEEEKRWDADLRYADCMRG